MVTPTNGVARGGKRKPILIPEEAVPRPPRPPRALGVVGRRAWKEIWRSGRRWLDPKSDALVVELCCRAFDTVEEIERNLASHGRYYFTKSGQELPRPGVADVRALRAQIVSWLALLGFTPSARAEMGQRVETPDDALTRFRNRKHGERASSNLVSNASEEPRSGERTEEPRPSEIKIPATFHVLERDTLNEAHTE